MKRNFLIALMFVGAAGFAAAQMASPTSDVLGAHLNYGRGCTGCHAPHSGVYGNGNAKTQDPTSGNVALWGEDVSSLYGKLITSGSTDGASGYQETLPTSTSATTPDVGGLLMCLSCHDGNYARGAMMKNKVYENLPSTYGTLNDIPTLLGYDKTSVGNYLNDHPVGMGAKLTQPGDWSYTASAGSSSITVKPNGPQSNAFFANYGFFVSLKNDGNGNAVVMCTTCHNQHMMNAVQVTSKNSGLTAGTYQTMFFIRAPYNPASGTSGSNQTAQFCRQCHFSDSNEANGGLNIPTTF